MHNDVPVTWLASYPRSGNTLLRMVLKRCFGVSSQSLYGDAEFSDPTLCTLIGHEPVGDDPKNFLEYARRDGRRLFVKTHELPGQDRHPAIYMLRDGRSAVVSFTHYLRHFLNQDVTLADVIRGNTGISWSKHVKAWVSRPDTFVLRYEELAAGDAGALTALADFIRAPQQHAFDISFNRLRSLDPGFFRCGLDGANISEMDEEEEALFDQYHGQALRSAGYGGTPDTAPVPPLSETRTRRPPPP